MGVAPEIDCVLLGTGTSGALPAVACLTSPDQGCHCCRSTLDDPVRNPLGLKNVRRNTSALLRIRQPGQAHATAAEKTILIDCGKTFYSGAVHLWPKLALRQIDALILTHAHADAILGLDDLRGWTLRGAIQKSIPIYLTQDTYNEVSKTFPYLTNAGKVTGGGDVPALTWHIFDQDEPFEVAGIEVVPLPVEHGQFFTVPPSPFYCLGFLFARQLAYFSDVSHIPDCIYARLRQTATTQSAAAGTGMRLRTITRWSEPKATTKAMTQIEQGESTKTKTMTMTQTKNEPETETKTKVLIVDCLRVEPFASHFGLGQAVEVARRLAADRTYLVGFGHRTSHQLWLAATRLLSLPSHSLPPLPAHLPVSASTPVPRPEQDYLYYNAHPDPTREDEREFVHHARWAVENWLAAAAAASSSSSSSSSRVAVEDDRDEACWIRPAVDGMTIRFGGGRETADDEYENEEE
ncbi:hypothetical protein JCM3774_006127 [Rhodotorula dairenensis]